MSSPLRRKRRRADKTGRSVGVERHVRLHFWMMNSAAWQTLSLSGRCLLVELYALFNGENNGELFLSVREAAKRLRISKNTAGDLFTELKVRGFVRPRQEGSFHYKERHATAWVLTEFGFAGQLATKDFMHWRPAGTSEAGPNQRDSVSQLEGQIAVAAPVESTICPSLGDRNDDPVGGICPSHRDTDKLPSPVGESGTAATLQPTVLATASTSSTDIDQPTIRQAGRQRHRVGHDDGRDTGVWDIEEYLATKSATTPTDQTSPTNRLRDGVKAKLATSPKGTQKALALLIGVSPCHLSNFLGGRFGLTNGAIAMLQDWIDGRIVIASPKEAAA